MAKKSTETKVAESKPTETKSPTTRKPRALKGDKAMAVDSAPPAEPASALASAMGAGIAPDSATIRARAYEIWREEGGAAMENWLRAERELRG